MRLNTCMSLIFGLILAPMVGPAWGQRSTTAKETKADTLKEKIDRGDKVLIIDVRTDEEVKSGSIPGAIHIPIEHLEKRMKEIPRDVQLVFT